MPPVTHALELEKMKNFKNILIIVISSLFLTGILTSLIIYFFISFSNDSFGDEIFNRKLWVEHQTQQGFPRLEMIDDLTKNHIKIGMKKSEVIKLLGKPDSVVNPFHLAYYLAPNSISVGSGNLHLIFDKEQALYFYDLNSKL